MAKMFLLSTRSSERAAILGRDDNVFVSGGVKYCMRRAVLIIGLVLCATRVGLAQTSGAKSQHGAIQIAKRALISNFDSNLPRISLEYFLNYEAAGASVGWEAMACPLSPRVAINAGAPTCVVATIELPDGRVAMVSVAVNALAKSPGSAVELRSTMITDESGAVRKLPLIELPAAIHRKWRKMPQFDLSPSTLA
jgi:hypothetical protein